MRFRPGSILFVLFLAALPGPALAVVNASFRVTQVTEVCRVNDSEVFGAGDPELHFRAGIFDASSSSIFNPCAAGCAGDSDPSTIDGRALDYYCGTFTTCGTWNFADVTLTKVIPDQSGAYFYFGLWDEDVDASDLMGDHWFYRSAPQTTNALNNNLSPYYSNHPISTVCGNTVEGGGWSGNYRLYYSVDLTDTSPPSSVPAPVHLDNTEPSPVSTDDLLRFVWAPAQDPNSGIDGYVFSLYDATAASTVYSNAAAPSDRDLTLCPSGCDVTYTPESGHAYMFRVGARNGAYPSISNPSYAYSAWVDVSVAVLGVGDADRDVFALSPPLPNPTRGPTMLRFTLPRQGRVRLSVFDLQGREVARPREGRLEAGSHQVMWDGRDPMGRAMAAGVYLARLTFEGATRTERFVITR